MTAMTQSCILPSAVFVRMTPSRRAISRSVVGGGLEDLREISADLTADEDRRERRVELAAADARGHVEERLVERAADLHLLQREIDLLAGSGPAMTATTELNAAPMLGVVLSAFASARMKLSSWSSIASTRLRRMRLDVDDRHERDRRRCTSAPERQLDRELRSDERRTCTPSCPSAIDAARREDEHRAELALERRRRSAPSSGRRGRLRRRDRATCATKSASAMSAEARPLER